MKLEEAIMKIKNPDRRAMQLAEKRLDSIAKPLKSLGKMEDLLIKCAGIIGSPDIDLSKKAVVVMCADNGVVEEGVTQVSSEVTALVADNMTKNMATINVMASRMGADVFVVDIGIQKEMENELILPRKIRKGTANMAKGPAMTRQEAVRGIETGIELAILMKEKGYGIIATGEMGIGNTTTSSAVLAVLLGEKPEDVTGKGAGLSAEGIKNKAAVIQRSIELNQPDPSDPLDVLSKVGGLDIAGICGLYIGGGVAGIPVLIDGFISSVAALLALRICPSVENFIFATHLSNEPASRKALAAIGLPHLIECNMCLGEGTGAVTAFGIFDLAEEVYRKMSSFEDIRLDPYQPFA